MEKTFSSVCSVRDIRAYEINAVWLGLPLLMLMENAGRSIADYITRKLGGDVQGKSIVVFVGKGGNGGDGLVAARHLASRGAKVIVVLLYRENEIEHPDTLFNLKIVKSMDRTVKITRLEAVKDPFESDILIDAMLGVGVKGKPREPIASAIRLFNKSRGFKISVDVPTGVDPDTGNVADIAVKADATITFHKLKPGLIKAREYVGEVIVANIGLPPEAEIYVGPGDVKVRVRRKPPNAHKGMGGRVLVIGGSELYTGAPALAALASLRAGADLAFVIAPKRAANIIASYSPNIISHSVEADNFIPEVIDKVIKQIGKLKPHSIIIGPGLGLSNETREFTIKLIEYLASMDIRGIVIDADALKHIANTRVDLKGKAILTPHRRELSILLNVDVEDSLDDKICKCIEASRKYNAVVLLKGQIDVICFKDMYRLNKTGTPAMSVGGTGDVLSGVVVALLARGLTPYEAAQVAAYINGRAGEIVSETYGERITATDLLDAIPKVFIEADKYPYINPK